MCSLGTVSILGYPIPSLCLLDQNPNAKLTGPEPITVSALLWLLSPPVPMCSSRSSLSLTSHFLNKKVKGKVFVFLASLMQLYASNFVLLHETKLLVI